MLDTPATDTALGLRDAALLELLYGTGPGSPRPSALDVDDDPGVRSRPATGPSLRLLGKGSKERVVPVGLVRPGGASTRTWSGPDRRWPPTGRAPRPCS